MLDVIEIFGYDVQPNFSTLQMRRSGTPVATDTLDKSKWFYNAEKRIVHIETKNFIDLCSDGDVEISWKNIL
ncbi:unnamed protein product [Toxocara canis]|uniref:Phage protein n=1 Tax=Toxocara canis TaxID=6265 RepID=A0A183U6B3_TOXCA|nr:unnamed protein product [Toxocara canis]